MGCQGAVVGHSIEEDGTEIPSYVRYDDRVIELRLTLPIEIRVPSDFPVVATEMVETADWLINDWTDGRYPLSTEMMQTGAARWASAVLDRSIENHYDKRVETQFGSSRGHRRARDQLVARCRASLGGWPTHLVEGGRVEVSATTRSAAAEREPCGRPSEDGQRPHVVLYREDNPTGGLGAYVAAPTVHATRSEAETAAASISCAREPRIVPLVMGAL